MKNIKIIAFILLSVVFTIKSYSQEGISFHIGPSIPMGDFGSGSFENDEAGGAALGLNVGLKYLLPITENGLGVFGGIDFNYNALQGDVKDEFNKMYEEMGLVNADITYSKYINIPLSFGLNYGAQLDEKVGLFVNGGLVINTLKITNMEIEYSGQTATQEMDLTNGFGFKLGGGLLLNSKTSVSLDYYALGKHEINGVGRAGNQTEEIKGELSVNLLTLTVGFKL